MSVREKLIQELHLVIKKLGADFVPVVEFPVDSRHGDFTSNVAMILAGKLKRKPMELAEEIVGELKAESGKWKIFEKIEVVKPGFINFWLSTGFLYTELDRLIYKDHINISTALTGKRIFIEYAHPNTHKEMHIGHMRTLITGEALARIFEAGGAKVFRANYQGDIGPHVAKALYGISKMLEEKKLIIDELDTSTNKDKAHFLGEGYVRGNIDYETHKEEIDNINKQLYERDGAIMPLYEKTRQWSLDYYEDFYKRFYTKFDRLFFENEMVECGIEIVKKHTGKIFEKDNGAIIFPGEKYGLHTRVFITQAGYPTYEGKEMCNGFSEVEAFPFDKKIHVVASEQAGYFQVVFKALELISPEKFKDKQYHISMGMVQLSDRKMSSRTGDILTVDWLIDEVKSRVERLITEQKISAEEAGTIAEQITIGAVKYSVLRVDTLQNATFDIEKSVSLEGNSGPYLQYTYARTQSVLRKWRTENADWRMEKKALDRALESEEMEVLRLLVKFEGMVREAAERYAPNIISNYLFTLAQAFNLFYQKLPILKEQGEVRDLRLGLTLCTGKIIRSGLELLGIQSPERM